MNVQLTRPVQAVPDGTDERVTLPHPDAINNWEVVDEQESATLLQHPFGRTVFAVLGDDRKAIKAIDKLDIFAPQPVVERLKVKNEDGWWESLFGCNTCGALVHATDVDTHLAWHRKHDEEPVVR